MSNLHKMKKGIIPEQTRWFLNLIHSIGYHKNKKGIWAKEKQNNGDK